MKKVKKKKKTSKNKIRKKPDFLNVIRQVCFSKVFTFRFVQKFHNEVIFLFGFDPCERTLRAGNRGRFIIIPVRLRATW